MSVRLNCPSCNHAFDLAAVPEHRRATCPRCGDVFPVRGEAAESAAPPTPPLPNTTHQTPNTPRRGGWPLWKLAVVALPLLLIGFAVGYGVHASRPKPTVNESRAVPPLGRLEPLDRVPLIDALPAECNVVFAVRIKLITEYAARAQQDPRDLLVRTGVPAQVLAALDQLGVGLEAIDHIAGGAHIGDEGEKLRVAFGVAFDQFRPPPDRDALLKRLKAKPTKTGLSVELGGVPINLVLGFGQDRDRHWLFGLNERDVRPVDRSAGGGRHFRGVETRDGREQLVGIRKLLQSVWDDTAVWVVADDERDWSQKPLVKLAVQSPEVKKWLPPLSGVRGGMFAVSLGEKPQMSIGIRAADTVTAERIRAYFRANGGVGAIPGADLQAGFSGPLDPALLRRMLADAGR